MKNILLIITSAITIIACKPKQPEHTVEFQGKFYNEPNPVQYDSNGDGVIDNNDDVIEVLGNSLDVSETPNGKPLYISTADTSSASTEPISAVPSGQKLCYNDLQRYCDKNGGLYAYETTMNSSIQDVKAISDSQKIDDNDNGIPDYIETIRANDVASIIDKYYKTSASQAELLIEAAAGSKISAFVIENAIKTSMQTTFYATLYKNNDAVDLENIEQSLSIAVAQAIKDVVEEVGLSASIDVDELEDLAFLVSTELAAKVINDLGEIVSKAVLDEHRTLISTDAIQHVQGLCPNGYHIPSDTEWLLFEQALGMDIADLMKSGETVTDRGANNAVVQKMITDHGFDYSGYVSKNGTYAQLNEAGVFWSSSVGEDSKGTYVWVRQIDTSYTGVVRFKLYNMSGLSIRCFKD